MLALIVDDSPLTTKVIEAILQTAGHTAIAATNGREGLVCLESVPDIEFVISDVEMPEMDGLSFLEEIRRHVEWDDLPFILSTSRADAATVKKAMALGCKHYLIKPPDETQLLRKVQEAVGQEIPILLQKSLALNRFGITPVVYDQLLDEFNLEIEETIGLVKLSMSSGELEPAINALRKIRESASLLGAGRLTKQFEKLPKDNKEEESAQVNSRRPAFLRELLALRKFFKGDPAP